jgi:hypothetical protein
MGYGKALNAELEIPTMWSFTYTAEEASNCASAGRASQTFSPTWESAPEKDGP